MSKFITMGRIQSCLSYGVKTEGVHTSIYTTIGVHARIAKREGNILKQENYQTILGKMFQFSKKRGSISLGLPLFQASIRQVGAKIEK